MSLKPKLLDGAVFIADAHENARRHGFSDFLARLESGEIAPPQLFLMGDIFDLLFGDITHVIDNAKPYITRLEALAKRFPIYYFEGNHDFNLAPLFEFVHIIPLSKQPMCFESPCGEVWMSHGDKYGTLGNVIYTKLIRQPWLLKGLNALNELLGRPISRKLIDTLEAKKICGKIHGFEELIKKKLVFYPGQSPKTILEGHYHQNHRFEHQGILYVNFSSFACDQSYFVVQCSQSIKFAQLRGGNV